MSSKCQVSKHRYNTITTGPLLRFNFQFSRLKVSVTGSMMIRRYEDLTEPHSINQLAACITYIYMPPPLPLPLLLVIMLLHSRNAGTEQTTNYYSCPATYCCCCDLAGLCGLRLICVENQTTAVTPPVWLCSACGLCALLCGIYLSLHSSVSLAAALLACLSSMHTREKGPTHPLTTRLDRNEGCSDMTDRAVDDSRRFVGVVGTRRHDVTFAACCCLCSGGGLRECWWVLTKFSTDPPGQRGTGEQPTEPAAEHNNTTHSSITSITYHTRSIHETPAPTLLKLHLDWERSCRSQTQASLPC